MLKMTSTSWIRTLIREAGAVNQRSRVDAGQIHDGAARHGTVYRSFVQHAVRRDRRTVLRATDDERLRRRVVGVGVRRAVRVAVHLCVRILNRTHRVLVARGELIRILRRRITRLNGALRHEEPADPQQRAARKHATRRHGAAVHVALLNGVRHELL